MQYRANLELINVIDGGIVLYPGAGNVQYSAELDLILVWMGDCIVS